MSRQEVQSVVDSAIREAILRRHEYITVEHILYSILQYETGSTIIRQCGGNVDRLLKELLHFFSEKVPELPVNLPSDTASSPSERANDSKMTDISPIQTLGFRRILERAMNQVVASGKEDIEIGDLLVAIFLEQDSYAVLLLRHKKNRNIFHSARTQAVKAERIKKKGDGYEYWEIPIFGVDTCYSIRGYWVRR